VDQVGQFVLFHDGGRDDVYWDFHILIASHWSVEIEILDVSDHAFGARSGDDAVEENFGCGQAGCFGADIARILDSVAANGGACALGLRFLWTVGCD